MIISRYTIHTYSSARVRLNGPDDRFVEWLERSNYFCNASLKATRATRSADGQSLPEKRFPDADPLLVLADEKGSWINDGDEAVKKIVSFAPVDHAVSITSPLEKFAVQTTAEAANQIIST